MSVWAVEVDDDLLSTMNFWSDDQKKELYAILLLLRDGGPEAMGLIWAELEGVPSWSNLAGPVSLQLPISLPSGWKILSLEVQANFRVVIVKLE